MYKQSYFSIKVRCVTNVGDEICWWQVVTENFIMSSNWYHILWRGWSLTGSPTQCHQHTLVTNIHLSPTCCNIIWPRFDNVKVDRDIFSQSLVSFWHHGKIFKYLKKTKNYIKYKLLYNIWNGNFRRWTPWTDFWSSFGSKGRNL